MRIPIKLIPEGVIPRDPNLTFHVERESAATTAATITETVTVVQTNSFLDRFLTGTSLVDHLPDAGGGAYVADGGGALSAATIAGGGGLDATTDGPNAIVAHSPMAPPLGTTYYFEYKFTLDAVGADRVYFDMVVYRLADIMFALEMYLDISDPDYQLHLYANNDVGGTLFNAVVDVEPLAVGSHTVLGKVSPAGFTITLDGAVVYASAAVSDFLPDAMQLQSYSNGPATTGKLDSVRVYTQE